jgi:hypothetical protein
MHLKSIDFLSIRVALRIPTSIRFWSRITMDSAATFETTKAYTPRIKRGSACDNCRRRKSKDLSVLASQRSAYFNDI